MRAAIVSNDSVVQERIADYLDKVGFAISAAHSVSDSESALGALTPDDLLVLDCVDIPQAASIEQAAKQAGCRSVGLIADQQACQMEEFLAAGLDDLLVRPVAEDQLLLKLNSLGFNLSDA